MPQFKITLTRTWTESDTLEREIEADALEQANERALSLASEYDLCCPDDVVTSKSGLASDWQIEDIEGPTADIITANPTGKTEAGAVPEIALVLTSGGNAELIVRGNASVLVNIIDYDIGGRDVLDDEDAAERGFSQMADGDWAEVTTIGPEPKATEAIDGFWEAVDAAKEA